MRMCNPEIDIIPWAVYIVYFSFIGKQSALFSKIHNYSIYYSIYRNKKTKEFFPKSQPLKMSKILSETWRGSFIVFTHNLENIICSSDDVKIITAYLA